MKLIFTQEKLLDHFKFFFCISPFLMTFQLFCFFFFPDFIFQFWMLINFWLCCFKTKFTMLTKMPNNFQIKGLFGYSPGPCQSSCHLLLCGTIFLFNFNPCQQKATAPMLHTVLNPAPARKPCDRTQTPSGFQQCKWWPCLHPAFFFLLNYVRWLVDNRTRHEAEANPVTPLQMNY